MNKKITAVTLTALMVLTMFTALVPTASAAIEVSAPYEFMGAVEPIPAFFNLTSKENPGILYYDIDEKEGKETLVINIDDDLDITDGNFTYTTSTYDSDDSTLELIAWTGESYAVIVNETSEMWISEYIVDEDDDDEYILRVGESLSLPEGFSITAEQIDIEGDKALFTISQDGEELDTEVVDTKSKSLTEAYFVYDTDLDDDGDDDDEVMNFTVETVFAGTTSNVVKIKNIDLISMNTIEIKNNDDDLYKDYIVKVKSGTVTIELDNDEDISLNSDGVTDIFGDRISIRINEDDDYAAVVKVVTIGGAVSTATATATATETVDVNATATVVDGTPTGTDDAPPVETTTTPEPTDTDVPGFEAVFAVAGLLAVAYLVLRQRE